jgi:putative restriction endonuclease
MIEPKDLQSQRTLDDYCKLLAQLNVSNTKKRGEAQYKPILILSVFDLIAQGEIAENKILISAKLIETFTKYWNILSSNASYVGGLHYPFYHLRSDGFWH